MIIHTFQAPSRHPPATFQTPSNFLLFYKLLISQLLSTQSPVPFIEGTVPLKYFWWHQCTNGEEQPNSKKMNMTWPRIKDDLNQTIKTIWPLPAEVAEWCKKIHFLPCTLSLLFVVVLFLCHYYWSVAELSVVHARSQALTVCQYMFQNSLKQIWRRCTVQSVWARVGFFLFLWGSRASFEENFARLSIIFDIY